MSVKIPLKAAEDVELISLRKKLRESVREKNNSPVAREKRNTPVAREKKNTPVATRSPRDRNRVTKIEVKKADTPQPTGKPNEVSEIIVYVTDSHVERSQQ